MNIWIVLRLLSALRSLRHHDRWTRQQLEAHQASSLRLLRDHTYARSPFYRRFHKGLTDHPLNELPVVTKAAMMEHFDELVTDRAIRLKEVETHVANLRGDAQFLGRYRVSATSGSTGHPGLFLFNRSEWISVLASFARAHEWAGLKVSLTHRMRMASVASTTPWHMSAQVGATLRSWWMPALRLAASEPVGTIVRRLNAWRPEMLVAYASMARILAAEQLAGRLHIAPHLVFTSSEVLTGETRRLVEKAWGNRLFNQYAATETGGLAAECDRHQGLHLFEDLVITEVVDKDNRPVPPGAYGDKLLITVLFNRTQPLSGVRDRFVDETLADALKQALEAQGAIVPPVKVLRVTTIPQTTAGKAPLIKSNAPVPSMPSGASASAGSKATLARAPAKYAKS